MIHRSVKWMGVALLGTGMMMLTGCAALNSGNTDARLADSDSALGYHEPDWHRSFWDRLTGEAKTGTDSGSAAAAVALPPRPVANLRSKVGVYVDAGKQASPALYQLVNALKEHAAQHDMTIVGPDALADALAQLPSCSGNAIMKCRQALAVYPGLRALLVIGSQPVKGKSDVLQVKTQLMDNDFSLDYRPLMASVLTDPNSAASSQGVSATGLAAWSNRVLDLTASRLGMAPWFTHAFLQKGNDVYLSSGRLSGLAPGTELAVHDNGSEVKAPDGEIVGWNPGPIVGKLKIKRLLGEHMAIAKYVSGRLPQPNDRLTAQK